MKFQSKGVEGWVKIQETVKRTRVLEDGRLTNKRKRKVEGNEENPI